MEPIRLQIQPHTSVTVQPGSLGSLGDLLRPAADGDRVLLTADTHTAPLYGDIAARSLESAGFAVTRFVLPAGEEHKRLSQVEALCDAASAGGLDRRDTFAALGGGVCGDMTGLAASLYLRGVKWVCIPTTLLAMADSAVGGKTAVDSRFGKNLIGAFHPPVSVVCDTDLLATLSPEEYANGMAEVIKTGLLFDPPMLAALTHGVFPGDKRLPGIAAKCVRHKGSVVEQDPRDGGLRMLLNCGHTAAHAIERLSGYAIPHGRAVAAGLCITARAAERLGYGLDVSAPLEAACARYGLPITCEYAASQLAEAAAADKKRSADRITLALPVSVGQGQLLDIPIRKLSDFFKEGL